MILSSPKSIDDSKLIVSIVSVDWLEPSFIHLKHSLVSIISVSYLHNSILFLKFENVIIKLKNIRVNIKIVIVASAKFSPNGVADGKEKENHWHAETGKDDNLENKTKRLSRWLTQTKSHGEVDITILVVVIIFVSIAKYHSSNVFDAVCITIEVTVQQCLGLQFFLVQEIWIQDGNGFGEREGRIKISHCLPIEISCLLLFAGFDVVSVSLSM